MSKKSCFWTRKLELQLVDYIRDRPFIWKSSGNTNYQIQKKYRAYAEFAACLGVGFTARSVRDRWVNIRTTYNHNVKKVEKSKAESSSGSQIYEPCWPLWKPLQFLANSTIEDSKHQNGDSSNDRTFTETNPQDTTFLETSKLRQQRIHKATPNPCVEQQNEYAKCQQLISDLISSMQDLSEPLHAQEQTYWFFGKHVTQRLNAMSPENAELAADTIMRLIERLSDTEET